MDKRDMDKWTREKWMDGQTYIYYTYICSVKVKLCS